MPSAADSPGERTRELRAIVADDEPPALRVLAESLAREPDVEVVARCRDGREALEAIRRHEPDLAFLDIRMPELDGFEVVDALDRAERPRIVFVTAYDEHALRAFQAHAVGYLLKPFDEEGFRATMDHLRTLLERPPGDDASRTRAVVERILAERGGPRRLVVRSGARTRLVPVASIDWIEAQGNYARLHCGDETHLVSRTLTDLAESLGPAGFARIHRSTIVNLARVEEFRTEDHRDYTAVLETGRRLRLSRTYRAEVEARLGDRI